MSFDKCRSARANSSEVLEHLLFDLEGINFPKVSVLESNIVTFKCFTLKKLYLSIVLSFLEMLIEFLNLNFIFMREFDIAMG